MYGINKPPLLLLFILTLTACGGGGGGSSAPPTQGPTTPPPTQPPAVNISLPRDTFMEGETVTITASVDTNAAATYEWRL